MEGAARDVADLARRAAVAGAEFGGGGGGGGLRVAPEELLGRVTRYLDEMMAVRGRAVQRWQSRALASC